MKCDQPTGWKVADHPSKGPQGKLAPEGRSKGMTMIIRSIMMMIMMMTMVIVMCFLHPKGPLTGLVQGFKKTVMMMMIKMMMMMIFFFFFQQTFFVVVGFE